MNDLLLFSTRKSSIKASIKLIYDILLLSDDLTVDIYYSKLNYKDTLAIIGKGKLPASSRWGV